MNTIVGLLGKVLFGMLMKLLTADAIEDLILFGLKKLVDNINSKATTELYLIVLKYLKEEK